MYCEGNKLERQRSNEITKKEKMITINCLEITLSIQAQVTCTRKITNKEKNRDQVNMIKNSLTDLMEELKKRPRSNSIKIKNRNSMVEIVERILFFNHLNQEELGLNILTPSQMFSRLPITFAQLKAGNKSEKCKNEIRQILYSLYRSKNLQKCL